MKSKLLIVIFFGYSQIALAQPGYMGKRFSLGYYLELFPHANFSGENSPRNEAGFEIEPEHHLNATWVVNRRWELIADVSRRNREYTIKRASFSMELPNPTPVYTSAMISFNERYQMVHETYWMFGIRKYFWNQIAPVGLYHQFAYVAGNGKYKAERMHLTVADKSDYPEVIESQIPITIIANTKRVEAKVSFFSYGIGLKRPITKSFYGSAEVNIQIPLSGYSNNTGYGYSGNIDDFLTYHLIKGITAHNFIDLRVGVGWMF